MLGLISPFLEGFESPRRRLKNSVSSVTTVTLIMFRCDAIFESYKGCIVSVKSWCVANRNERSEISLHALAKFIEQELKQNSQRVIRIAFNQAILMSSPKIGMAVVV